MPSATLADWLRSSSDEALTTLLRTRRDLATPPPADSGVLATRAGTPGSIARACEDLDTPTLAILETLLIAGADTEPVHRKRVYTLLGLPMPEALQRLRERALVWGEEMLSVAPGAREVFGPYPAGLGNPIPDAANFDLGAAIDGIGDDERDVLLTLAAGPPIGTSRDAAVNVPFEAATTPVQRLLARGLLRRRDNQTVELPLELGILLRGGSVHAPETLVEPELPTHPHQQTTVDEAAAGEAAEFLRQLETLLRTWSTQPAPVLKSGGLGVRELRRLAKDLEVTSAHATLLVEVAVGAGLAAVSEDGAPEWVPTTLADSWLASAPSGRWLTVAQAWLDLPRLPALASTGTGPDSEVDWPERTIEPDGSRGAKPKPVNPLSEDLRRPLAPTARHRVLGVLAELPRGAGVKSPDDLVRVLAWRAPRRGGRLRDDLVRWTLAEASAMGIVAMGALPSATGALLEGDAHGAASAMADAMPTPVGHVFLQADLTVVAPGPLEPDLATEIEAVADVESAGHATVYRVTEATVRRALDTGRTADELHELFRTRSATPVPQGLSYLVDDVARRHGRLRGGAAACFLRCDDEVLLAEVLGSGAADHCELRRIAPTVLVSPYPLAEVLNHLRAAGFAPAAEGPDGKVLDLRPSGRRVPARARPAKGVSTGPAPLSSEQLTAVLAHLRAGDRATSTKRGEVVRLPGGGGADTSATLALLTKATREQREVWIGIVDSNGTASQRVLTPVRVGGGVLEGSDNERYPLHRITSAALVEDE